jgi:hypothetical protein
MVGLIMGVTFCPHLLFGFTSNSLQVSRINRTPVGKRLVGIRPFNSPSQTPSNSQVFQPNYSLKLPDIINSHTPSPTPSNQTGRKGFLVFACNVSPLVLFKFFLQI